MKKKNIKISLSIFIFCILINIPNTSIVTENCHQIIPSEEVGTSITMEDVNDKLTFRIDSSRDVVAFRLSYIVNHTNGSSFYAKLGGLGDIYGGETFPMPETLKFWSISKKDLLFYHNGGILYKFWMDIYFINPIAEGIFDAGQISPDPFLSEDENHDLDNDDDDGGDDANNTDENEKMSIWVWIILGVIIVGSGVYGFFLPKKKVAQSRSNEENNNAENLNPQSAEALERRRMRVRTNRNTRNHH